MIFVNNTDVINDQNTNILLDKVSDYLQIVINNAEVTQENFIDYFKACKSEQKSISASLFKENLNKRQLKAMLKARPISDFKDQYTKELSVSNFDPESHFFLF